MPTVKKVLTNENVGKIYDTSISAHPCSGDRNICTITKKEDGIVYLSVVSIKGNEILEVHDQKQLIDLLQQIIFSI